MSNIIPFRREKRARADDEPIPLYLSRLAHNLSRRGGARTVLVVIEDTDGAEVLYSGFKTWDEFQESVSAASVYRDARRWYHKTHEEALAAIADVRDRIERHRVDEEARQQQWEVEHPHRCGACTDRFKSKGALTAHIRRQSGMDTYYRSTQEGTVSVGELHRRLVRP